MKLKIKPTDQIVLDTISVWDFLTKGPHFNRLQDLYDAVYFCGAQCVISYVTYIEIISRCLQNPDKKIAAKTRGYLTNSAHISIYPIDYTISDRAALLLSTYDSLGLSSAIILATADICGADYVVTDQRPWLTVKNSPVVFINDI